MFKASIARGLRHPADDRGHEGAHRHARDRRRDRSGPPRGRRQDPADQRIGRRHEGGDRARVVPARRRASASAAARADLRRTLFEETGGMYPELVTRGDLDVFLPPIGGQTVYMFGDPQRSRRSRRHAHRARARRVQRLRRVRLGHLHVPAVSHARDRGVHPRRAGRRRRAHRLLPQGRPRARRGHEVPRLQRAQAPAGRRPRRRSISRAPSASPACRTCASRS